MTRVEVHVGTEQAGRRLDSLLAQELGSRAHAQRLIEQGRVTVDGQPRPKSHQLAVGEVVLADVRDEPSPLEIPTASAQFRVAFEDEHLIVVDKPAGLVVHPGRGNRTGTLAQALAGQAAGGDDPARAGIVHRLDRDTSGLLVVARSEHAHRSLRAALSSRAMRREYVALVAGRPGSRTGLIDAPIGRDPRFRTRMSVDSDVGKEARTRFAIEEALEHCTLLGVTLDTGRTHQIRVHLAAIGTPVLGDPDYGTPGSLGLTRQFLHARRLTFAHPVTGAEVDVTSELPDDLRSALERARAGEG